MRKLSGLIFLLVLNGAFMGHFCTNALRLNNFIVEPQRSDIHTRIIKRYEAVIESLSDTSLSLSSLKDKAFTLEQNIKAWVAVDSNSLNKSDLRIADHELPPLQHLFVAANVAALGKLYLKVGHLSLGRSLLEEACPVLLTDDTILKKNGNSQKWVDSCLSLEQHYRADGRLEAASTLERLLVAKAPWLYAPSASSSSRKTPDVPHSKGFNVPKGLNEGAAVAWQQLSTLRDTMDAYASEILLAISTARKRRVLHKAFTLVAAMKRGVTVRTYEMSGLKAEKEDFHSSEGLFTLYGGVGGILMIEVLKEATLYLEVMRTITEHGWDSLQVEVSTLNSMNFEVPDKYSPAFRTRMEVLSIFALVDQNQKITKKREAHILRESAFSSTSSKSERKNTKQEAEKLFGQSLEVDRAAHTWSTCLESAISCWLAFLLAVGAIVFLWGQSSKHKSCLKFVEGGRVRKNKKLRPDKLLLSPSSLISIFCVVVGVIHQVYSHAVNYLAAIQQQFQEIDFTLFAEVVVHFMNNKSEECFAPQQTDTQFIDSKKTRAKHTKPKASHAKPKKKTTSSSLFPNTKLFIVHSEDNVPNEHHHEEKAPHLNSGTSLEQEELSNFKIKQQNTPDISCREEGSGPNQKNNTKSFPFLVASQQVILNCEETSSLVEELESVQTAGLCGIEDEKQKETSIPAALDICKDADTETQSAGVCCSEKGADSKCFIENKKFPSPKLNGKQNKKPTTELMTQQKTTSPKQYINSTHGVCISESPHRENSRKHSTNNVLVQRDVIHICQPKQHSSQMSTKKELETLLPNRKNKTAIAPGCWSHSANLTAAHCTRSENPLTQNELTTSTKVEVLKTEQHVAHSQICVPRPPLSPPTTSTPGEKTAENPSPLLSKNDTSEKLVNDTFQLSTQKENRPTINYLRPPTPPRLAALPSHVPRKINIPRMGGGHRLQNPPGVVPPSFPLIAPCNPVHSFCMEAVPVLPPAQLLGPLSSGGPELQPYFPQQMGIPCGFSPSTLALGNNQQQQLLQASAEYNILLCQLCQQIEYYFSPENLIRDTFLRKKMDCEGFVLLSEICNFNRVKHLTSDPRVVMLAVKRSDWLEMMLDNLGGPPSPFLPSDPKQVLCCKVRTRICPERWCIAQGQEIPIFTQQQFAVEGQQPVLAEIQS